MRFKYFLLGCLLPFAVLAQDDLATKYAGIVSPERLRNYLTVLAADALEGRETGMRGQKMAAALIQYSFKEAGLQPPVSGSYYQRFNLYASYPQDVYVECEGDSFMNFKDIIYYGQASTDGEVSLPLVFGCHGTSEELEALQAKGKALLVVLGQGENSFAIVSRAREAGASLLFIVNALTDSDFHAFADGMKDFIEQRQRLSLRKPDVSGREMGIFYLAPSAAAKILKVSVDQMMAEAEKGVSRSALKNRSWTVQFRASGVKTIETENVLGYLEGSDKNGEVVVVTAHYDHIGILPGETGDRINNGADDDGSGTATVMTLADAFSMAAAEGHRPRRSMLFMTFTGEEKGLLGSEHYAEHPVFPLSNTVVDLNIDMIGRRDAQHEESPPYTYVIGSDKLSSALHKLSERVNATYTHLEFDYTYNDENDPQRLYYRSDHWNFAKNNVPVIFYFDGIHEDYHKPSDEVSKIEFDLLAKRAQCVFYTAWEIANREERIMPDPDKLR